MTLKDLLAKIKHDGGRMTKTRQALLENLVASKSPLSAAQIVDQLKKAGVSVDRTTVYRELNYLLKNKIIKDVRLIGQPALFELESGDQHHLICLKCKSITPIAMGNHLHDQEKKIMEKEKFKITDHCLEFYGLCHKCQQ